MTKKISTRDRFFKKLFKELDEAYSEGSITLAYIRRVMNHYGMDVADLEKTSAMARRSTYIKEAKSHTVKKNPPNPSNSSLRVVKIYDRIEAIEAIKGKDSLWKNSAFRHDFKSSSKAEVFGLSDGSILIRSKNGKKLWNVCEYDDRYDGVDAEKRLKHR
jgi:hypothetical protein